MWISWFIRFENQCDQLPKVMLAGIYHRLDTDRSGLGKDLALEAL